MTFHYLGSRGVAERKYTYHVSSSGVCSCINFVAGAWCNEIKKTAFLLHCVAHSSTIYSLAFNKMLLSPI